MEKKGKEAKAKVLWKLFISTLYLSAFTFGGGYVIVTLMKKKFVDDLHWIDEKEMLDLVAIAQSSPGAIAVNGAIVVGYKLAGIAVVAMIASAGILILISAFWGSASAISFEETKWSMVVIFILCVISLRKTKINPVWVMVLAGLMKAGLALTGQWV